MAQENSEHTMTTKRVWMSKNLLALSWVSLLQDAASEMLYPLLPVLLNSILAAPAAIVGVIEGVAEGAAALTKLLSARINRYLPRKNMVLTGYAAAALGKIFVAAATVWPVVLIGRVVDRLGKGMRSASRDAILLNGSPKEHRGKIVGFHRMADTTGAVIGPLLALGLLSIFNNEVRPVLWFAVIPGVLSTLAVLLVRDRDQAWLERREARRLAKKQAEQSYRDKVGKPQSVSAAAFVEKLPLKAKSAIVLIVCFSFLNFPDALLLLHLNQVGFSISEVVGVYLLFNITNAALSLPAGILTDRFRPNQIYAIGLLFFALTYLGLSLTTDHLISTLLLVSYGAYSAVQETVGKSWVSKLAPESRQLWAQSLLQGISGFGVLIAGVWAGIFWLVPALGVSHSVGSGGLPLEVSGVGALLVAIVALRLHRFKS